MLNIFIYLLIILLIIIIGLVTYLCVSKFTNTETVSKNKTYDLDYFPEDGFYFEIDNALTDEECDSLIKSSKDKLVKSEVMSVDKNGNALNKLDTYSRTSHQYWQPKHKFNKITQKIENLVNSFLKNKITSKQFEDIQVARYKPGQEYKYHYDICDPDYAVPEHLDSCKADFNKYNSVRYATVIIYLNDGFNGGETRFTKLNKNIKPKKGKALLFFNCNLNTNTPKTGKCNMINYSEHAGLPVENPTKPNQPDEKWIANIWIRTRNT